MDFGGIFTDTVVKVFEVFLQGAQHGAIQGFTDAHAGSLNRLLQLFFLDILIAGKLDVTDGRPLFDFHHQDVAIALELNIFEVAGGIQLLDGVRRGLRIQCIANPDRQVQQGSPQSHPLQPFNPNVLHNK